MITPPTFITAAVLDAMAHHAEAEYPREACGLVLAVDGVACYLPRQNGAENPARDFRISPQAYAAAERKGRVLAVVHSHPGGPAHPSESDMAGQIASGLAWAVIPVLACAAGGPRAQHPLWWGVGVPVDPLLEREFVHGLADCYALVRDWYRTEAGILLPDFPRPDRWWERGGNLLAENLAAGGFVRCDEPERVGDGYVMQVQAPVPNHCAVYVGDGLLLHHLCGRLSRREPVHRWRSHILYRVRHQEVR